MRNSITKRVLAALIVAVSATAVGAQSAPAVAVFKSATCGCCAKWVDHVRANGFAPTATNVDDMNAVKAKHNVPQALHSCHTALVGGYVIEGHVPAADIKRLLKERPAVVGLAVPGMPAGSPGMEGPPPQKYDVVTFDKQGKTSVFATHGN